MINSLWGPQMRMMRRWGKEAKHLHEDSIWYGLRWKLEFFRDMLSVWLLPADSAASSSAAAARNMQSLPRYLDCFGLWTITRWVTSYHPDQNSYWRIHGLFYYGELGVVHSPHHLLTYDIATELISVKFCWAICILRSSRIEGMMDVTCF